MSNNRESYSILIKSFKDFFLKQSRILIKEIKTIKYAVNYYRYFEDFYEKNTKLTKELEELEIIYDGIRNLENKSNIILEQFEDGGNFSELIENINKKSDNSHITVLPIIDSKINQFKDLFDELNFYKQSYFNLIDSKQFSYIPSPKFNKRFRNANLGLYLNKQLNDKRKNSYRTLVSNFYEDNNFIDENDNSIENFKNTNFFATWSHSTDHLIKNFKSIHDRDQEKKNIYISMSYAYLDKTILQPIAFHEISHSMKHKKLDYETSKYLEESLFTFRRKNIFKRDNPLDDLYKEILCDLSAVYATGYSYIISLVHVGFFELEDLFSEYKQFDSSKSVKDLDKDTKNDLEIKANKDIVPNKFDFNINNIYLTVRLLILIELCEKLKIKNTYIDGIKYMLDIIFPDNDLPSNEPNFLSMYNFITVSASDFKQSRNLIYSLFIKFQDIILTDSLIENFKMKEEQKIFNSFKEKLKSYGNSKLNSIICKNSSHPQKCKSIYDLLWLCREKPIENITGTEINRLFNIYNLFYQKDDIAENNDEEIDNLFDDIFKNFFYKYKTLFYELELIKYKSIKGFHPFIEFMKGENDNFLGEKSYVFAPYDIALFKVTVPNTKLENIFKNYPFRGYSKNNKKYFIDRHSLFLLKDINGNYNPKYGAGFSTIVQIKLLDNFSQDKNIKLIKFLLHYFDEKSDNSEYFSTCKIFKSLGAEDYVVYVKGIEIKNSKLFGKYLTSQCFNRTKIKIEIEDLILLDKINTRDLIKTPLNNYKDFQVVSFSKININSQYVKDYYNLFLNDKVNNNQFRFLPDREDYLSIKTPTNRFDCLINWKEKHLLRNIYNYLNKTYYEIDDNESFFSDFNIEIMHSRGENDFSSISKLQTELYNAQKEILKLKKDNVLSHRDIKEKQSSIKNDNQIEVDSFKLDSKLFSIVTYNIADKNHIEKPKNAICIEIILGDCIKEKEVNDKCDNDIILFVLDEEYNKKDYFQTSINVYKISDLNIELLKKFTK